MFAYGPWFNYSDVDLVTDCAFPYLPINVPTTLPFTLEEVKAFLRVANPADTSEDLLLTLLMQSALQFAEKYTKLTFFTTEFETYRNYFSYSFQLRKYPVQSVISVSYLVDQVFVPVDPLLYFLTKTVLDYPYVVPKGTTVWPINFNAIPWQPQSIKINFFSGFGDDPTDIPPGLRLGMLNHIAAMYENRGDCCDCDSILVSALLPKETKIEYNMWKIMSVGPSRN